MNGVYVNSTNTDLSSASFKYIFGFINGDLLKKIWFSMMSM